MLSARTHTSLNMRVTPMLHPCYTHWLEERHVEIQWSPATKMNLGTCKATVWKAIVCCAVNIFFCRQTMPDSTIALLLGSDIMTNSIWSLNAWFPSKMQRSHLISVIHCFLILSSRRAATVQNQPVLFATEVGVTNSTRTTAIEASLGTLGFCGCCKQLRQLKLCMWYVLWWQ